MFTQSLESSHPAERARNPGVTSATVLEPLTLSVFDGGLVLLDLGLCRSGEGRGGGTVAVVHQVAGDHAGEETHGWLSLPTQLLTGSSGT